MANPDKSVFTSSSRIYTIDALRQVTRQVLGIHLPTGIQKVVELGCGDGFFYREIAPKDLKPLIRGYDNHRPSLELFRHLSPEVQTELAEANNLDLPDGSVDVVIGFSAFPLFKSSGVSEEILRVMRPGGRVFMFQDNLIVDQKGKNDLYDKMQRVEAFHLALESKFTRGGWLYKAGVDVMEAVVVTPYDEMQRRVSAEVFKQQRDDSIIIAATRDIGAGKVHFGSLETFESDFKKIKSDLGNPQLLANLRFVPGLDVPEYIRLRYLVAEKRSW